MGLTLQATPVLPGTAQGPVLRLPTPLSFWGGVDPKSGRIVDPSSIGHGRSIAGVVLVLPSTRGSSSASAVLLELLHTGQAPAAIILGEIDAILGLGILVAGEMDWPTIPLLLLAVEAQATLIEGARMDVARDGTLTTL